MRTCKWFVLLLTFLPLTAAELVAQQVTEVAERELERFPWYESGALKDLPRLEPGPAKSLNRREVPERIKKPKKAKPPNQPPTNRNQSYLSTIIWLVLMAGVLALVAIMLWVFLKQEFLSINKNSQYSNQDKLDLQTRIKQLPFQLDEETLGSDLRELALTSAQQGKFARATMLLFSHVLLALDRRGHVKLKKGKTNRQYLQELRKHESLSAYFKQVMVPFEDSFFGNYPVKEQKFYECWNRLDQFQCEVEQVANVEEVL